MAAEKTHEKQKTGSIKIKWVVSDIGSTDDMRATIKGLGLRKMHRVVERQDNDAIRGMIQKFRHLGEGVKKIMAKQVPSARKRTNKRGDHKPKHVAPKGTND